MNKIRDAIVRLFVNDWLRKLLALVLAIAIYESVYNQNQKERLFSDVSVKLNPASDIYIPDAHSWIKVSVKVKGPEQAINNLNKEDIRGEIAIGSQNKLPDGIFGVSVKPDYFDIHVPGCRVAEITPNFHRLEAVKSKNSKKVKVNVKVDSSALSQDYTLASIKSIPEEILITGPEDIVNDIKDKDISTELIKIQSLQTEGFEQDIAVNNNFLDISVEPRTVHIQCEIENAKKTRSFKSIPVLIAGRGSDSNVTAELQSPNNGIDVEVSGAPSRIGALKDSDISAYVDTTGKETPGLYTLQINCNVKNGNGIKIERVSPGEAIVKIESK